MGFRYALHPVALPGKPDLALVSRRKVIFVHGCFWHKHSCRQGRKVPATNEEYWEEKRLRNLERDRAHEKELRYQGLGCAGRMGVLDARSRLIAYPVAEVPFRDCRARGLIDHCVLSQVGSEPTINFAPGWSYLDVLKLAAQRMTLEDALGLLGETCVDVHLNGDAWWAAVPVKVWEYTLGGYQVLKKWLSYREFPLLGRALKAEESAWFAQVVRRIAAILLMGPALDESYRAILPGARGLPRS